MYLNLSAIKNKDLQYVKMSDGVVHLTGWVSDIRAIGRTDFDSPSKIAESAHIFATIDKKILAQGKKLTSVETCCYDSGWKTLLIERIPLMIQDQQYIAINGIDLTDTFLAKNFIMLKQHDNKRNGLGGGYIIGDEYFPYDLTERQKTCLFYLVRGKSLKQIAAILKISVKTVEEHISIIKRKLNCFSKSQLIEKAIESGFLSFVPTEVLY